VEGAGDRQNSSNRRFAAMDPEKQWKLASKGGRSSDVALEITVVNDNSNQQTKVH